MANIAERQAELVSPDLRALSDLAAAVAQRSDEIEEFLGRICTTLARSFGFDRVVMHRYYEATNDIAPLVAHGRDHFALEQRELERLNELKSQFVALASHELRTPAASIYGAAVTLQERAHELEQEQLEALRDILFEQSDRLRVLVEELLDLSRLDAGSIRIQPERIEVTTRLHRLVEELFAERVRDLRIQVEAGLVARADPSAFDRIVSNLLANAFRYGEPPVTIEAAQGDSGLRVSVEDRGPGVPPEFVPRLFERFTRAQPSGDGAGTGLGLSIAQALAQAHGAEISYRPAHPHGARFELELPAAPAD